VPPLAVVAGQTVTVDFGKLGGLTVSLR